ncbi:unnamed protein product [Dicrocoelium dendriticum]|nr:unnamed protein product [Dicrocoelium dendriticum]
MVAPNFCVPSTNVRLGRQMSTVLETSTSQACGIATLNNPSFTPIPSMCPIRGSPLSSSESQYGCANHFMSTTNFFAEDCCFASELSEPGDKCKKRNDFSIVVPRLDSVDTESCTRRSSSSPIPHFAIASDGLITPSLDHAICPLVTTLRSIIPSKDSSKVLASSTTSPSLWAITPQSHYASLSSSIHSSQSPSNSPAFVSSHCSKPIPSFLLNGHYVQSEACGNSDDSPRTFCTQQESCASCKSHPTHPLKSTTVSHPSVSSYFFTSSLTSSHQNTINPPLSCSVPGSFACDDQPYIRDKAPSPSNQHKFHPIHSEDESMNFASNNSEGPLSACQRHLRNYFGVPDNLLCSDATPANYWPSCSPSQFLRSTSVIETFPMNTSIRLTRPPILTQELSGICTTSANVSRTSAGLPDSCSSTFSDNLGSSANCLRKPNDIRQRAHVQKDVGKLDSIADHVIPLKRRSGRGCYHRMPKRRRMTGVRLGLTSTAPLLAFVTPTRNCLFAPNPTHFLHDPVVSVPAYLYPPTPAPTFLRKQRGLELGDRRGFILSPDSHLFSTPRKYDIFPFFPNSPTALPSDSVLCDLLAKNSNDVLSFHEATRSNFLLSCLRQAMCRTSRSRVDCSPVTNTHPLDTHLLSFHDCCAGHVTPPLYTNTVNLCSVERTHTVPQLPEPNTELSRCGTPIVCAYCAMQIIESSAGITYRPPCGGAAIVFCSFFCLITYQTAGCIAERDCIRSSLSCHAVELRSVCPYNSTTAAPSSVLLLRRKYGKPDKITEDRLCTLVKNGHWNRTMENLNKAQISKPFSQPLWRWNRVRWYKYSKQDSLKKPQPFTNPRFVADSSPNEWIHLLMGTSTHSMIHSVLSNRLRDDRACLLCHGSGDAPSEIAGRLLQYAFNKWLHLNCILWCYDAYETVGGSLINVSRALTKARSTLCSHCKCSGAGLPCFHSDCQSIYHLPCAHAIGCTFHVDRAMYCPKHQSNEGKFPQLHSLAVNRRVFICRDESAQVADIISKTTHPSDLKSKSQHQYPPTKLRIGGLTLHSIGQLLPEQLASGIFHSTKFIYPVGYSSTRIYWSYRHVRRRCFYHCKIEESDSTQETLVKTTSACIKFVVVAEEFDEPPETFEHSTCDGVWKSILARINRLRTSCSRYLRIIQENLSGEFFYGLTEPHIVRAIESLPGVDRLSNYSFKFGRLQLIKEMPLAINPTGCARSEPKLRTHVRRLLASDAVHSQKILSKRNPCSYHMCVPTRSSLGSPIYLTSNSSGFSKLQQYKRLRAEWSLNVVLARSRIQGLGLFAARDLSKHTYIIEYLGELIRNEVGNCRELLYDSQNRGVYMFRVDDDNIVDATMCGGLARYINHSCEPNCAAEILYCDGGGHIIIVASRDIVKGEELTYDYKFDIEDHGARIPCLCGSISCRKWMN